MAGVRVGANLSKYDQRKKLAIYDAIGRQVARVFHDRNITQSEVCRATGVSLNTMQQLIHGENIPLIPLLLIARELGVTVDSLVPQEALA